MVSAGSYCTIWCWQVGPVSFDGARQQKRVTDALPKRPKLELLNTLFMARYEKHAGGHTLI